MKKNNNNPRCETFADLAWVPMKPYFDGAEHRNRWLDSRSVQVFSAFDAFPLPESPDWAENPFQNRTWQLYFHALCWLHVPLSMLPESADSTRSLVVDYLRKAVLEEHPDDMIWDDHATAYRAATLNYAYTLLNDQLTSEERDLFEQSAHAHTNRLLGFIESGRWKHNNHTLFHVCALWDCAQAFPGLADAPLWKQRALAGLEAAIENLVNEDEGVSVEQSTYYHQFAIETFIEVSEYFQQFGVDLAVRVRDLVTTMIAFDRSVLMQGDVLPALGDTAFNSVLNRNTLKKLASLGFVDHETAASGLVTASRARRNEFSVYPESGLAAFRRRQGHLSGNLVFRPSRVSHGHHDALSFTLASRGKTLLVDSGGPYVYGDSLRYKYFVSELAHNCLIVGRKPDTAGAQFVNAIQRPDLDQVAARCLKSSGVTHTRTMVAFKDGRILIGDYVETPAKQEFDLLFHFAPEAAVSLDTNDRVTATFGARRLTWQRAGSDAFSAHLSQGGENEQFPSWVTPNLRKKLPSPLVRLNAECGSFSMIHRLQVDPAAEQGHGLEPDAEPHGYVLDATVRLRFDHQGVLEAMDQP